ncbi:hypothetical protein AB205_0214920, partial [Aquarana catesbeiana]
MPSSLAEEETHGGGSWRSRHQSHCGHCPHSRRGGEDTTAPPHERDGFIGFGGNVIRQQVKEKAKWYITDFEELLRELDSDYAGFDETQLTAESGGKGKVIGLLKEKYGFYNVVMIGDGATDMEACPPA